MADFPTLESSVEDSKPIELYEFALGGDFFRFTSAEDTITVGADDYEPLAISRGSITQGNDPGNRILRITIPSSTSIAQKYITVPPGEKASLNIFRLQRDEVPVFDTQVLLFKGRVHSVAFPNDGHSADFVVKSIESAMLTNLPRFTFASMCPLVLYSSACGAVASSFDHFGVASSVTDNLITVAGANASGIDFTGGYLRPLGTNDFRMITAQSGDVFTLLLPFHADPNGENMQAFAGCDHLLLGDCALVFDQVINYGGYHFVPKKDIFRNGLL